MGFGLVFAIPIDLLMTTARDRLRGADAASVPSQWIQDLVILLHEGKARGATHLRVV